jgi:phosphoglycolate phosphatase
MVVNSLPMKHVIFDCDGTLVDTSGGLYKLYPGIKQLLVARQSDCLFYVWTGRGRQSTLRVLEELGIILFFNSFSTPDDGPSKPHIQGLRDLLGPVPKSSICVIGDSVNDILGAKNFGVMAIGASWNKAVDPEFLKTAGADFVVSDPMECSKLIELNLKGDTHV